MGHENTTLWEVIDVSVILTVMMLDQGLFI
jgi:hypothetical protein